MLISEVLHPFPEPLTRDEIHTVIGYPLERYYGYVDDVDAFDLFDAALPAVDDRLRETTGKGILETYSTGSKTVPIRLFSIMGPERLYFHESRHLVTYTDTGGPLQAFLGAMYRYCHKVLEKDAGLGNGPSVATVFGIDLRKTVDRVFRRGDIARSVPHDKPVRGSIRVAAGDAVVPEIMRIQSDRRYMLTSTFHSELARYTGAEPNGPCDYVSSGCRTPQPSRMTAQELQYYLYWRSLAREGRYGRTDQGYLWLYRCELINDPRGPDYVLDRLAGLGRAYDGLLSDSWGGANDPPGRTYLDYAFVRCPRIPDPTVYPCSLTACDMAEAILEGKDVPLSPENFMILSDVGRSTSSDRSLRASFTYDCACIAARVLQRVDRDGPVQGRVALYCGLRHKVVRKEVFRGLKYYGWPGGFQRMQERPMADFVGNVLFQDGMGEIVRAVVKAVGVRGKKPRDARAFGVGLSSIVLEETDRWFSEKGAAAAVSKARGLAFDQAGIRRAEEDLGRVTELIGTEAEDHDDPAAQDIREDPESDAVHSANPWEELVSRLDVIQEGYLKKALAGFLPVAKPIVEGSINGIAMDVVKDAVIEDGNVFEEYVQDLERVLRIRAERTAHREG